MRVLVIVFLVTAVCLLSQKRGPQNLEHCVYVWQRNWTPQVNDAISELPESISGILPLAAEVGFSRDELKPVIKRIHTNGDVLRSVSRPRELVIRIGGSAVPTHWNRGACEVISQLCRELIQLSNREKWGVSGIQIDYDCPASLLGDYVELLRFLRTDTELKSLQLSFTALPSWLDTSPKEFSKLTHSVDYFVIQVHALQLPKVAGEAVVIIEPTQARKAVAKAGAVGIPFYVALPTYSSFIVFDEKRGKVVDVISEDLNPGQLSSDQRLILGESSPADMAELVRDWTNAPPSRKMKGIIWYRLPVSTDIMNWPNETWQIVMSGNEPKSSLEVVVETQAEGFARISIKNTGQQPESSLPERISLTTNIENPVLTGDGGLWYQIANGDVTNTRSISFELIPTENDRVPLPIGSSVPIGWVRLEKGEGYDDLKAEFPISKNSDID